MRGEDVLTPEQIRSLINTARSGKRAKRAKVGQRYYEARHDILDYRVFYTTADGRVREERNKSNLRIPHPFFTELVDQKVQYLLSGDTPIVRSDIPALQSELDEYFGDAFRAELAEVLTGSAVHGWAYLYAYRGDERLTFMHADGTGVIDVPATQSPDGQPYVIYRYTEPGPRDKTIERVQVWDSKQVTYFAAEDGKKLALDDDAELNPRPHVVYQEGDRYFGESLGFVPFFRLDNSQKQTSDLAPVKALIDDYDLMSCGMSNNIQDIQEGIYVVKGWEGDDLDELINNVQAKKHINVPVDGDLDVKTVNIPYEARKQKLELDERNIYRFGMGFNAAQTGDGNITNVVIKARYALLDLKCNKAEHSLRRFLRNLIDIVLDEINARLESAYTGRDVYVQFDREMMTNELDNANIKKLDAEAQKVQLETILAAAARLDDETVVQGICAALDIDYEQIKDRLSPDPYDLNAASEALAGGEPDA